MCGAAALTRKSLDHWIAKLKAEKAFEEDWDDKFNLRPYQTAPIIIHRGGKKVARLANFGLVPSWMREFPKFSTLNARSEEVEKKPTYSKPFKTQRGILPAIGYYEWMPADKLVT